jgi:hypothetical protein
VVLGEAVEPDSGRSESVCELFAVWIRVLCRKLEESEWIVLVM